MANFLNTHDLPKLKPEDLNSLNRPMKSSKIEAVIKCPGSDDRFTAKFYQTFTDLIPTLFNCPTK